MATLNSVIFLDTGKMRNRFAYSLNMQTILFVGGGSF